MQVRWCVILLLPLALTPVSSSASAQTAGVAAIDQPNEGEVLRGTIEITGTTAVPNFAAADLSFAYEGDRTNTWFALEEIDRPITGSRLGT